MRLKILPFLLLTLSMTAYAESDRPVIAFYNVENLYDTIPSLFHNDKQYLPNGSKRWGKERYGRKLENLARVIDDMDADILGICEVESEQAVRELIMTLKTDYNYVHLTGNDHRGMDLAFFYKGDKFIPYTYKLIGSGYNREFLYVRGELCGQRLDFVVCHLPSNYNSRKYKERAFDALYYFADSLHRHDPDSRIIIMGDFNTLPSDPLMKHYFRTNRTHLSDNDMVTVDFSLMADKGFGTYAYKGRWQLLDNIFVSVRLLPDSRLKYSGSGIFIRKYMLDDSGSERGGYPLRTFSGARYLGGYSDHLPVYVLFDIEK